MDPSLPAAVLVVSGRALAEPAENRTGALAEQLLGGLGLRVVSTTVVDDDAEQVRAAISDAVAAGCRLVLTCGGTGLRDEEVTVEATRALLEREIPGIGEEIRRVGAQNTPLALLSRGTAGVVALDGVRALVVNAPGSRGGVRDTVTVLEPLLAHLLADLSGQQRS